MSLLRRKAFVLERFCKLNIRNFTHIFSYEANSKGMVNFASLPEYNLILKNTNCILLLLLIPGEEINQLRLNLVLGKLHSSIFICLKASQAPNINTKLIWKDETSILIVQSDGNLIYFTDLTKEYLKIVLLKNISDINYFWFKSFELLRFFSVNTKMLIILAILSKYEMNYTWNLWSSSN